MLSFVLLILTLIFVVFYTHATYNNDKIQKLKDIAQIIKIPNLSLGYSQWESRFYDDYKNSLFPDLKEPNYMDFTYEK